jgi:chromate reductase
MRESTDALRVCGIAGSLRKGSFNRAVLRAASQLALPQSEIVIFDGLGEVPLFNQDLEEQGDPLPVEALKEAIGGADALLISTPEYSGSIPGVLKNALDWAARKGTADSAALARKPVAIMGASPGRLGTARAQPELRHVLTCAGALVMPKPEVHLMSVGSIVSGGELVDEVARRFVGGLMESLVSWTRMVQRSAD